MKKRKQDKDKKPEWKSKLEQQRKKNKAVPPLFRRSNELTLDADSTRLASSKLTSSFEEIAVESLLSFEHRCCQRLLNRMETPKTIRDQLLKVCKHSSYHGDVAKYNFAAVCRAWGLPLHIRSLKLKYASKYYAIHNVLCNFGRLPMVKHLISLMKKESLSTEYVAIVTPAGRLDYEQDPFSKKRVSSPVSALVLHNIPFDKEFGIDIHWDPDFSHLPSHQRIEPARLYLTNYETFCTAVTAHFNGVDIAVTEY